MQHLNLKIEGGLATVTLNCPVKKNAVSELLFDELYEVGLCLQQTLGLRAVILTEAGPNFCAGIDL